MPDKTLIILFNIGLLIMIMIDIPSFFDPILAFAESDYAEQEEYADQPIYNNEETHEGSDYEYGSYDGPTEADQGAASPFDDAAFTDENSDVIINILSNDRAYYGDQIALRIDQVYEPSFGTVTVNADGSIIYRPSQLRMPRDSSVIDTFFYTSSFIDDSSSFYSGKITITINQINDAPRVIDSEYVIAENQEFSFYLKAYDEDNDKLTFFVTSDPTTLGSFVLEEHTGMITYTPQIDFLGQDFMTYVIWDGISRSDPATIMVDVMETSGNLAAASAISGVYDDNYNDETHEGISFDYYYDYSADYSTYQVQELAVSGDEGYSPPLDPVYPWSSNFENDNVTVANAMPIADAGIDQGVFQGEQVDLDGFGSYDPDGDTISYSWSQIFGPTVTLVNPTSANPTFVSPAVLSDTTIILELVVSDGLSSSDRSFVTIVVAVEPEVRIDILPNLYPNNINTNQEEETVPVAIFGSISLDVAKYIDANSLSFGPHSAEVTSWEIRDINTDAFDDLILYFPIGDLGLQSGNTESCLSGSILINGDQIEFDSCDSVEVLNQNL